MGSGSGSSSSTSQATIAPQLQPLFSQSGQSMMDLQNAAPLWEYTYSNPMQVAPQSGLQEYAADQVMSLNAAPQPELAAQALSAYAIDQAGQTATGSGIATDPAILAQQRSFEQLSAPLIENQMSLAGLGRSSSLANSLSLGEAQMLPGMYEAQLGREQGAIQSRANMMGQMVPQLEAMGVQDTARLGQTISTADTLGKEQQATAQATNQAEYQDYLRQQAIAEEALLTPFGSLVPSGAVGQVTTGSTGGGGMFK